MLYNKVDKNGMYLDLYMLDEPPTIESDGELIPDETFIFEPIPNDIYVSEEHPAKWTGTEWVATGEPPEPTPPLPTLEERLDLTESILLELMMG